MQVQIRIQIQIYLAPQQIKNSFLQNEFHLKNVSLQLHINVLFAQFCFLQPERAGRNRTLRNALSKAKMQIHSGDIVTVTGTVATKMRS